MALYPSFCQRKISAKNWWGCSLRCKLAVRSLESITSNYAKARYFKEVTSWLEPLYFSKLSENLSKINYTFICAICDYLNIETKISFSTDFGYPRHTASKNQRLLNICIELSAKNYISGKKAQQYLKTELFKTNGINVLWFDDSEYVEYPQLWGGFEHKVSILDLLFNCGKDSRNFLKY